MSIPKIKEIILSSPSTVVLYFDGPLETDIPVPVSSFTVNYGQYGVETLLYSSDSIISLGLDSTLSPHDNIFCSYEPPVNLDLCLRGPVPSAASDTVKKRNSVRGFYRVAVKNTLATDPETDGSRNRSNLGSTIGGQGYPYYNRASDPKNATPDDFVIAYGLKEAIQLTNKDDGSATSVNVAMLQMAIEDANSLIDSYIEQSGKAGMVLISSNRRRTSLIIARYYLDTVRKREDVYKEYEQCLKQLDAQRQMTAIRAGSGVSAIDTPQGILRSWRIPQRYNSVSGKGLSGWVTDTGGRHGADFRRSFDAVGQNNNQGNWRSGRENQDLGFPIQPTDGGGENYGSTDYNNP